jgi:Na+-transporting NADH:ubiquinone oxidoreductase subunit C
MKASLYSVLYAAMLGTVCAFLLTWAGRMTRPYREANARAEKRRSILTVLGVPAGSDLSPQKLNELFEAKVRLKECCRASLYEYREGQDLVARAVPFAGSGLWGPIRGLLALEPDGKTIRNLTFYQQEETPGLGGEIAAMCGCAPGDDGKSCSAWFRHQFRGKKIVDEAGKPGIVIRRGGGASGQNEVDGISGATMTCDKVQGMLNEAIRRLFKGCCRDAE